MCNWTTWRVREDGRVERCECQKRRIAEERLRVILKDWPEYVDARLESTDPRDLQQQRALNKIRDHPHGNFFLSGYFSRGKTHLMIAQYAYLALAGEQCILRSARDLMEELRRAEMPPDREGNVIESAVMQMVNGAPSGHLFIDDIEKASARTGFRAEMIFDLLDTIKRRQLGITVTSNIPLAAIADKGRLGDAAAARLYALCQELEL